MNTYIILILISVIGILLTSALVEYIAIQIGLLSILLATFIHAIAFLSQTREKRRKMRIALKTEISNLINAVEGTRIMTEENINICERANNEGEEYLPDPNIDELNPIYLPIAMTEITEIKHYDKIMTFYYDIQNLNRHLRWTKERAVKWEKLSEKSLFQHGFGHVTAKITIGACNDMIEKSKNVISIFEKLLKSGRDVLNIL